MVAAIRGDDPGKLADTVGANLQLSIEEKQELLEIFDPIDRLTRVAEMLDIEIEKLNVDRTIQGRVKRQMEKAQKEYYLNEKIKAIQKELGRGEKSEFDELKKKIEAAGMTKDATKRHGRAEAAGADAADVGRIHRLAQLPRLAARGAVEEEEPRKSAICMFAQQVLEGDHYGLEKIKERILEFLAVRRLVKNPKGSILCFVGPPGVGKTSLGMSIAKATGRKFVRMSLGGVRDEAEIRGHRRTYIGALPGQIIQMMKKAGTQKPGIHAGRNRQDVDRLPRRPVGGAARSARSRTELHVRRSLPGRRVRSEPGVLHRHGERDAHHSAGAAGPHGSDPPIGLHRGRKDGDRQAIPGSETDEANRSGATSNIEFTEEGLQALVQHYTREAGVRNLEREIGNVCRKIARQVVNAEGRQDRRPRRSSSQPQAVIELLGPQKFRDLQTDKKNEVGAVVGLAWTEVGGQILTTEATTMEGRGKLSTTGKLGDVMQESAHAAMSYLRSRAHLFGLPRDFYRHLDIHVHVPEGAIPKDGPSAGITIATAIASALTRSPFGAISP